FEFLDAVEGVPALSAGAFKLAYQLTRYTDREHFLKTGELIGWQSVPKLAERIGMKERQARRHMRALEAAGVVKVEYRVGHSSRYTLIADRLAASLGGQKRPAKRLDPGHPRPRSSATPAIDDRPLRSSATPPPVTDDPTTPVTDDPHTVDEVLL